MIHENIAFNDYIDHRFTLAEADGSLITDNTGKEYIDLASGWNVTNLGWNNSEVNMAVAGQAGRNVFLPMAMTDPTTIRYASELTAVLPDGIDTIGRATGGTEAVEMAVKTARAATGRSTILGFEGSYHGQLFASMALGHADFMTKAIGPLAGGVERIEYPDIYRTAASPSEVLDSFVQKLDRRLAGEDVAAIVCEAGIVTGMGSVSIAPEGFLDAVRQTTRKYGSLMILDEVGTGFSRTGELFGWQHEEVTPDLMTFAKAITNGTMPMGTMAGSAELIEPTLGDTNLNSTYGWTPLACAAASKTLEIHTRENVWVRAKKLGAYAMDVLRNGLQDHPHVGDIRGIGMEIGIDFVSDRHSKTGDPEIKERVVQTLLDRGVNTVGNGSVIQLMPALTMPTEMLDDALQTIIAVAKEEK